MAPAYDLTFSSGPGGEQSMLVMGEGRSPGATHLQALAKKHGIKSGATIIDEVRAAVARWARHADAAGVPQKVAKLIGDRIAPVTAVTPKSRAKTMSKPKR